MDVADGSSGHVDGSLDWNVSCFPSTWQMAVLLQYNNNDTLSLDELISATAISKDILKQVLAVLVKAKILINEETDQYDLNPSMSLRLSVA